MGLLERVLERHGARDLERHLRRIDRVEGPIVEADLHVHYRIAGQSALVHRLDDPLLDRRYELAGDGAADDGVFELEPRATGQGRDFDPRVPKLPATAGLLFVASLGLGGARDRLL